MSSDIALFVFDTAYTFVLINVILMVFNLLPIAPLDGWRALLGVIDARTAFNLRQYEQYGFIVLLLLVASTILSLAWLHAQPGGAIKLLYLFFLVFAADTGAGGAPPPAPSPANQPARRRDRRTPRTVMSTAGSSTRPR